MGATRRERWRIILVTTAVLLLLGGAGSVAFVYAGIFDIAANEQHTPPMRWVVTTVARRSVQVRADEITPPPLGDAVQVRRGLALYQEHCLVCHGAPSVASDNSSRGLYPHPPPLEDRSRRWTDAELYWIVTNGLKMSGMPAYSMAIKQVPDRWAVVAFLRRLEWLSPAEYRRMLAPGGQTDDDRIAWTVAGDHGLARLRREGRPARGAELIVTLGCGSCHVIPGIPAALGAVGPPLTGYIEQQYIAGTLVNTPDNLVAWIMRPQAIEPGTAMPDLGVTAEQARDITAYLYTLGEPTRWPAMRKRGGE